LENENKLGMVG